MKIKISTNIEQFVKELSIFQKRELPFITSRALTWTAQDAREKVKEQAHKVFQIRTKWMNNRKTGFNIKPAKKNDLEADVHTYAPFLWWHESGEDKTHHKGKYLLVPTSEARRTARGRIAARSRRGTKLPKKSFIVKTKKNDQLVVLHRKNKKDLRVIFLLKKIVDIKEVLKFHETIKQVVQKRFEYNFQVSLKEAIGKINLFK